MKHWPLILTSSSLAIGVAFLGADEIMHWQLPQIETLAYCVIVLDGFLLLQKPWLMTQLNEIRKDSRQLLQLQVIDSLSDEPAAGYFRRWRSDLQEAAELFTNSHVLVISNPYQARDLSFDLIREIRHKDRIVAVMSLVDRPFLLGDSYTTFFTSLHTRALSDKKNKVSFLRLMVVDAQLSATPVYRSLVGNLRQAGVQIVELSEEQYRDYGFDGDLLLRARGKRNGKDWVCLLGDRDPPTPVDKYEAKVLKGESKGLDNIVERVNNLLDASGLGNNRL